MSLGGLAAHAAYYHPFLVDDALISLRYAQRLLAGHGLTWTDGPPVEGYSNFLWTIAAATLGAFGLDLITAIRVLGFAGMASVVGALRVAFGTGPRACRVAAAAACASWVLAAPTAIWVVGGLEPPMVAGLLAGALVLVWRALDDDAGATRWLGGAGALLAALALTRPDGILFTAGLAGAVVVAGRFSRRAWRSALWLAALPLAAVVAQEIFRLVYYHDVVPNTAYAKVSPSRTHLARGLRHVGAGLAALRPLAELAAVALVVAWRDRRTRAHATAVAVPSLLWMAYVIVIGGDIFAGWRHLVPVIVGMSFALGLGARALVQAVPRRAPWRAAMALGGVAVLGWFSWNQFHNEKNHLAKLERWQWDGEVVGRMLARGFGDKRPLIGVTAAGGVPYWSRLPSLDLLGLNDRHIARHPPPEFGEGWPGHELGDARYVMQRRPDLILFGTPKGHGPVFTYEKQLAQEPAFRRYALCAFLGTEPYAVRSNIWVDRDSPRLGIRRDAASIEIPAYLLDLDRRYEARLDPRNRFYVPFVPGAFVGIRRLQLEPGVWRLEEPTGDVRLQVRSVSQDRVYDGEVAAGGAITVRIPETGAYDLGVQSTRSDSGRDGVRPVYRVRLRRIAPAGGTP